MISAGSAVSDSSTAPSTDCSASRFCGGATGPSNVRPPPLAKLWPLVRSGALMGRPSLGRCPVAAGPSEGRSLLIPRTCRGVGAESLLLLGDDRLHRGDDAVRHLDVDHSRAHGADRLVEADVAAIDVDPARLLDRVDDVLRGDRAGQAAVLPPPGGGWP